MVTVTRWKHAVWAPAVVWAYLALARGRFWSTSGKLPKQGGNGDHGPAAAQESTAGNDRPRSCQWPTVAIVVPARDEAAVLPVTLPSLLAQEYPGNAWVVLVDDQSSDGTGSLARQIAVGGAGTGLGLDVVTGQPRPPGWAGKPWAMNQGALRAARAARAPEWLLFTDADIVHPPSSLHDLLAAALDGEKDLVSLMARLSTASTWDRLLMPAFVYFFAQLYPFEWVSSDRHRTAAAAGGCLLANVAAMERARCMDAIASSTIDDVTFAKAMKRSGSRIWLGLAGSGGAPLVKSVRTYGSLGSIWSMVARSAYTQLGHNPVALAATVAAMTTTYLAPPVLTAAGLVTGNRSMALAGGAAWATMTATYLPMTRHYGGPARRAAYLPLAAALYTAMTLSSARSHYRGGVTWKGRKA